MSQFKWDEQVKELHRASAKAIEAAVRKHNIEIDNLTEAQVCEAFKQAIASGDFQRYVVADPAGSTMPTMTTRQCVTYIPYQREQELEFKIKAIEERNAELIKKWRKDALEFRLRHFDGMADVFEMCARQLEKTEQSHRTDEKKS